MKYRKFGKLDFEVSALGFGAMRLPQTDRNPEHVDEAESIRMIRYAIDHGVNYVDTAYPYHMGKSEVVVGKALQGGYREKIKLATKLPSWLINSYQDCDRYLNEQMKRLQTDKIDFYLLHGLNRDNWSKLQNIKVLQWAEQAINSGRIAHLGFSFHDDYPVFKQIVDSTDIWSFCQIQYNYMDIRYQAGTRGLKYAANKGLAVVIMEPLRGGRLSKKPPKPVAQIWDAVGEKRTPAEMALLWVWEHSEVSLLLSGMSSMAQVEENIDSAGRSGPGAFSSNEMKLFDKVRRAYRRLSPIPCTGCRYCQPCPQGVEVPRIFEIYNDGVMYEDEETAKFLYNGPFALTEDERADNCIDCRTCIENCPQNIDIPQWLKKAHEALHSEKY